MSNFTLSVPLDNGNPNPNLLQPFPPPIITIYVARVLTKKLQRVDLQLRTYVAFSSQLRKCIYGAFYDLGSVFASTVSHVHMIFPFDDFH
jgi:hypothetical protein